MSRENQREWPRQRDQNGAGRRDPVAFFLTPDNTLKSDRSLAGPLRMGTAPGVGPRGALRSGTSDFEMDRVSPRSFDPIGTQDVRQPEFPKSGQISRELRRSKTKGE